MFDNAPHGYFIRDLIVFNGLRQGCFVSKGFIFEPPDLDNAQVSDLNNSKNKSPCSWHRSATRGDYRSAILLRLGLPRPPIRYQQETGEDAQNVWTQHAEREVHALLAGDGRPQSPPVAQISFRQRSPRRSASSRFR